MSIVYSGTITCSEEHGSPKEQNTSNGFEASVTLRCAWSDRTALMNEILGTPQIYPRLTSSEARARTASAVPDMAKSAADGQGLTYTDALVTINYTQGDNSSGTTPGGTTVTESLEPNAEFITVGHEELYWDANQNEEIKQEEAPGHLIVGFDFVQTASDLALVPKAVLTEIGKVNANNMTTSLLGLVFPAETLLFASSTPSRRSNSDGTSKWDLGLRYSFRSAGWNKFFRKGEFVSMYDAEGNEKKNYKTSTTLPIYV